MEPGHDAYSYIPILLFLYSFPQTIVCSLAHGCYIECIEAYTSDPVIRP